MPSHPLSIGSVVSGKKPGCACKNPRMIDFSGKVLKVINNHREYWYYLDSGVTVKDSWITSAQQ